MDQFKSALLQFRGAGNTISSNLEVSLYFLAGRVDFTSEEKPSS